MVDLKPQLVIYTRIGSIPYLSWNFVKKFDSGVFFNDVNLKFLVKLNIGDFMDLIDETVDLKSFDSLKLKNLSYFKNRSFILSEFDPLVSESPILKSTNDSVAIPTIHGKKMLSVDSMIKLSKILDVENIQIIADIATPSIAKRKWTQKSVDRSKKFMDETFDMLKDDQFKPNIWATITGGYVPESRLRSCEFVNNFKDQLSAIVIDGFYGYESKPIENGTSDEAADTQEDIFLKVDQLDQEIQDLICKTILPNLPKDVPKALFGSFLPDDILKLTKCGIQIFDSSICTMLTEMGLALPSPLIDEKTMKLRFTRIKSTKNADYFTQSSPLNLLDLNDVGYKMINIPISCDCNCYTCQNGYTRAYLNHLLKRNEINGNILIQCHNHFALTHFFHLLATLDNDLIQL